MLYESMKHTVVVFGFCVILLMDVYFIVNGVKHLVKWIRKKIRGDREPAREQE